MSAAIEILPQVPKREDPYSPGNKSKTDEIVSSYHAARRKMQDRLNPYVSELDISIDRIRMPFATVHIGDTHFSHDDAEPEALKDAVARVEDGMVAVTQSNIIDSITTKFGAPQTTANAFNLDQQEQIARSTLEPLALNGQLVCVGKNFCHEGWAEKVATHDVVAAMTPSVAPLIYSGGQIVFKDNDKPIGSLELYHNSGKGRTLLSPEGSDRERGREVPFGYASRPSAVVDAHMHQLFAAQDVVADPVSRKDKVTSYGEVGAAKGTKEHPDRFLLSHGVSPRNQPGDAGRGLILIWNKRETDLLPYPVVGYDRGQRLFEAERLWEDAQRTGNVDELKAMIIEAKNGFKPILTFHPEDSITRSADGAAKAEGHVPIYKTTSHDIATDLPVRIQFLGNLRIGSLSFEREKLTEVIKDIEENPWAFAYATRRLINQHVAGQRERLEFLGNLAETLSPIKDSLLGIMMTDELRQNRWAYPLGGKKNQIPGVYPGDWLYAESDVSGVPLIAPETVANLKVGAVNYRILLRDKLSNLTSLINPFHGLARVQQLWGVNADVLVGGHTEIVGWRTWMRPWGQQEIIVPGGFSEFIEKGVANRVDYPTGGQGVIFFPNEKLLYSFATPADGKDMHEAFWLREGLKQQGILDETKEKLQKKKTKSN